jgi:hypothetical protein
MTTVGKQLRPVAPPAVRCGITHPARAPATASTVITVKATAPTVPNPVASP